MRICSACLAEYNEPAVVSADRKFSVAGVLFAALFLVGLALSLVNLLVGVIVMVAVAAFSLATRPKTKTVCPSCGVTQSTI